MIVTSEELRNISWNTNQETFFLNKKFVNFGHFFDQVSNSVLLSPISSKSTYLFVKIVVKNDVSLTN